MKKLLFILAFLPTILSAQLKDGGSYYMANGDTTILLARLSNVAGFLYTVEFDFSESDSVFTVDFGSSLFNVSGNLNRWEFNSQALDSLPYTIDPADYTTKRKALTSYSPYPYPTFQMKINTTTGDSSTIEYKVNFFKP